MPEFDFSTFPTLTTPRLALREILSTDAADLFSFHSDPIVQQYDSDPVMQDLIEAFAEIDKRKAWFDAKKAISWGITLKDEMRVIGTLGFYFWDREYYKTELGYTLARPYWRRGIASEAVRAVVRFGFETLGLHRINVDTRSDNLASMRLMQKLGFYPEGVRRECIRSADGSYQSWAMFGLLEQEYRPADFQE